MLDLYLSKKKAEILGSRLQQWNLLEPGTTISSFRSRNQTLAGYYGSAENICYCKDIGGLLSELGSEHNPADWRLFTDSSKTRLKTVLLHIVNIKPSIPVGYSILRKETYNTMKILLDLLEYRPTVSFLGTFHYVSTVWRNKIRAWVSLHKTETIYPNQQVNKTYSKIFDRQVWTCLHKSKIASK